MTTYYLDSSVAVRIMLGHSLGSAAWFDSVTASDEDVISSRILQTELTRVLRREEMDIGRRDALLDFVGTVPLDHAILLQAESVVPHIKTLDAIHLGSAIRCGIEDLTIVTHDHTMSHVARLIGYTIHDPVAEQ